MFGEGMKVELLVSGCQVRYWTSNMVWDFQYGLDHPGATQQTLHLTAQYLEHRSHDVAVVIADPSHSVPGQHLLQRDRFLLFDPPKAEQLYGGSLSASQQKCSLQLLDGQQYRGRVYVRGTLIMREPLLDIPGNMQLGLNFVGAKQEQVALGLGRDRNSISVHLIMMGLPQLYLQLRAQPKDSVQHRQAEQLLRAVTHSLQLLDESEAATKHSVDAWWPHSSQQHWQAMVHNIHALLEHKASKQLGHHHFYLVAPDAMREKVSLHFEPGHALIAQISFPPSGG